MQKSGIPVRSGVKKKNIGNSANKNGKVSHHYVIQNEVWWDSSSKIGWEFATNRFEGQCFTSWDDLRSWTDLLYPYHSRNGLKLGPNPLVFSPLNKPMSTFGKLWQHKPWKLEQAEEDDQNELGLGFLAQWLFICILDICICWYLRVWESETRDPGLPFYKHSSWGAYPLWSDVNPPFPQSLAIILALPTFDGSLGWLCPQVRGILNTRCGILGKTLEGYFRTVIVLLLLMGIW